MINFKMVKNYCNEDISLIENYEKAISDSNQTWDCHHRREITTSKKELIENNEYYSRPAKELIFLTHSEHTALHFKGVHLSEETKLKMSIAKKNMSEETKQKIAAAKKGMCWFNNSIIAVRAKECPEGFVKGMIKRKKYEEKL